MSEAVIFFLKTELPVMGWAPHGAWCRAGGQGGRKLGTTSPLSPPSLCTRESERNGVIFLCLIVRQPNHLGAFWNLLSCLSHRGGVAPSFFPFCFSTLCFQKWFLPEMHIGVLSNYYLLKNLELLENFFMLQGGKGLGSWFCVHFSCTVIEAAWLWAGL